VTQLLTALLTAGCLAGLTGTATAQGPAGWGTVKGKVLYGGKTIPERKPLEVTKDQAHCLAKGPILSEAWVVDPKTKGVKDVFIWLEPEQKGAEMPVNPKLKNRQLKPAVMDQPHCYFAPHALIMEEGQVLLVKNPAPIPHNFRYTGHPDVNPGGNFQMVPNSEFKVKDLKADRFPVTCQCDIHPWMRAYIRVFNHPYYATTKGDGSFEIPLAPAGKYRLFVWHPESGWLGGAKGKNGRLIDIAPTGVDVGNLEIKAR
jgi:hypothetical protein